MVHHMILTRAYNGDYKSTNYRWTMVVPDGEIIDQWWREVSSSSYASLVKRISPDHYIIVDSPGKDMHTRPWDLTTSLTQLTSWYLLSDWDNKIAIPPVQPPRVDVCSGDAYYIRSKSRPNHFWVASTWGDCLKSGSPTPSATGSQLWIWSSDQRRTRFIIHLDGQQRNDKKGTVIVNEDPITITAVMGNRRQHVTIDDQNILLLGGNSGRIFYGDLKTRFLAQSNDDPTSNVVTEDTEAGEEWELVK